MGISVLLIVEGAIVGLTLGLMIAIVYTLAKILAVLDDIAFYVKKVADMSATRKRETSEKLQSRNSRGQHTANRESPRQGREN